MNPEFDRYFLDLTGPFGRATRPWSVSLMPLLSLMPPSWRSDARYFLAQNVYNMVVRPYRVVHNVPRTPVPSLAIWQPIVADVQRIVRRADEIASRRGRSYVSATSVAQALGELAPNLATTSLQIWGPDE